MIAQPIAAAAGDAGLPRAARILSRNDFLRVQREGRRVHTAHFVLIALGGDASRLGVTASRKVGDAVRRNRVKRLVREVFRCNRGSFPERSDVLVVARTGAADLDYAAVRSEIVSAAPALARALRIPASESKR